ncbi:hypothetical protein Tco_0909927 [Tanacetum coccineum]|uniref:Uncharacterized protein n=1 Tax=Tanacetum coccineum TaxID=301880 RepID=A0ABQ5CT46_9ASTR
MSQAPVQFPLKSILSAILGMSSIIQLQQEMQKIMDLQSIKDCWGTRSNQKKTTRKDRVPDNQHNYVQHTILCANVSVCSAEDCEDQIITLESVLDSVVTVWLRVETRMKITREKKAHEKIEAILCLTKPYICRCTLLQVVLRTWMKSSEGWWLETSLLEIAQEQVYAARATLRVHDDSNHIQFPSFKLLDEDSDEVIKLTVLAAGDPLVEINSDVCKIITERTVFYHIREKAKSLPSLAPKSTTEYLEYEETLNLIRKRTHERQLALNDNTESLKLIDDSNPCEESIEPDGPTSSIILNGDTIFKHIRKKAKSFPRVDEIKSLSTKSYNINSDFDFDLFADAKSNIVQKENVLIIDSDVCETHSKTSLHKRSN